MPAGSAVPRRFEIPSLDGLRFVAIFIVVWGHAEFAFRPIKGSSGVTLFFFLSGYLITTLLRRERDRTGTISIRDFYLRRFFRIVPPLYIVVTVMVALSLAGVLSNEMSAVGAAASYGFFGNYAILFDGREGLPAGMNALWSLAVEEHYYLIFPILFLLMIRYLPKRSLQVGVLIAICLGILAWRVYLFSSGASWDRLYLSTDTRADAILWGAVMALAFNPVYGEVGVPKRPWLLTPILVISALAFWRIAETPDWFAMTIGYTLQATVLAGVFIPVILAPKSVAGRILNWKPIAWVGIVSYSIYLIHRPALMLAEKYLPLPHVLQVSIAVLGTILVSWAMQVAIEQPFGRLRAKLNHLGNEPARVGQ